MGDGCCSGLCGRCHGVKKLVGGLLLLLNAFVWPQWLGVDGWIAWVAVLLVLAGLLKLFMPTCGHCRMEEMPSRKKRR